MEEVFDTIDLELGYIEDPDSVAGKLYGILTIIEDKYDLNRFESKEILLDILKDVL